LRIEIDRASDAAKQNYSEAGGQHCSGKAHRGTSRSVKIRIVAEAVRFGYILQPAVWRLLRSIAGTLRISPASQTVGLLASSKKLAEAVRFELTDGSHHRWFSRPVP